ncbi:hypothetical protein RFI_05187 [Reticulomyxa filosa]|uniref:SAM domain-containing protein n=1 Tax=Reticulomyxa filosa TaxID=46433 RepID=X6P143_RETFI|nr:hypothetical protein RFI_05187 [Reticulomyxa filosa]|eukprot:ETO31931.1 hypothetical protein RFI_05187 [Reticulomyxa filosa]
MTTTYVNSNDAGMNKIKPQSSQNDLTGGGWGVIPNQDEELSGAMRSMVESMQSRVSEQSRMLSEMEERILKDPSFGKTENADKWSTLEVCYWLSTIHLDKYTNNFSSLSIDGSILLNDLDESMLTTELGIQKIHLRKCMREITKLKEAVQSRGKLTKGEDKTRRVEELERQVASLQQINSKLTEQLKTLTERLKAKQSSSSSTQELSLQSNTLSGDSPDSTPANGNASSDYNLCEPTFFSAENLIKQKKKLGYQDRLFDKELVNTSQRVYAVVKKRRQKYNAFT